MLAILTGKLVLGLQSIPYQFCRRANRWHSFDTCHSATSIYYGHFEGIMGYFDFHIVEYFTFPFVYNTSFSRTLQFFTRCFNLVGLLLFPVRLVYKPCFFGLIPLSSSSCSSVYLLMRIKMSNSYSVVVRCESTICLVGSPRQDFRL